MRARFPTWAVVARGALAVGVLSIAVTLAASDADKWPGWLQPYQRWGWWSVLGLLAAAVALTAWQAARQPPRTTPAAPTTVHAVEGGLAAGRDVTITGGQGPTAGRDARTVTGGAGPTAGGDIHITTITTTGPVAAAGPVTNLPPRNLAFTGREELLDRLHQQLTTPTAAVAVTALAVNTPGGTAPNAETSQAERGAPQVLHGLGGVGKTQVAAEYAYRHASHYRIRWWVPAEQPAAIPGHLVALARQLGIPEQSDQTDTWPRCWPSWEDAATGCWCSTTPKTPTTCAPIGHLPTRAGGCWSPPATQLAAAGGHPARECGAPSGRDRVPATPRQREPGGR